MKCKHCNTEMTRDETKILTSNPPKHEYTCPKCGSVDYDFTYTNTNINNHNEVHGWVCPKCGSGVSPWMNLCPKCTQPEEIKITYVNNNINPACSLYEVIQNVEHAKENIRKGDT